MGDITHRQGKAGIHASRVPLFGPTWKLQALMYSYRLMDSSSNVMHRWFLQGGAGEVFR